MRYQSFARAVAATLMCGAAISGTWSASVSAIGAPIHVTTTVNVRPRPDTSLAPVGVLQPSSTIDFKCFTHGQNISGLDVWFQINSPVSGFYASYFDDASYSSDADLTAKYGIPKCGSTTTPSSGTYTSRAFPVYLCTNTGNPGCRPSGMPSTVANGSVTMKCWKDGSAATGEYPTNRWFWVNASWGEGYVTASVVHNQTSVPACNINRRFVAAEAAVARYGQVWASSSDTATFAGEWAPGPAGEWAGDCPKIPAIGWLAAGVRVPRQDALKNYSTWRNQGRIQGGVPPRGAIVFYNIALPQGHTAISLGNGYVATTRGLDFSELPNSVVRYNSYSNYLGYVLPA